VKIAVLDEAGDVGYSEGASGHFLVVVVVVGNIELLRKAVTRTRKRLDKRRRDIPEFKAFKTDPRIKRRLLAKVSATGCEITIVAANKRKQTAPDDPEFLYRDLCVRAARRCVEPYQEVTLILDKRYSHPSQTRELSKAISQGLHGLSGVLAIESPRDSQQERAIQAVDAVAWAVCQRLEYGDDSFYDLVKDRVVSDERVE